MSSKLSRTLASVVLAGSVVMAPIATAPAANAAGCSLIDNTYLFGRVGYLWHCSDGYHGQIANARGGDDVELRYSSGGRWWTYSKVYVPSGSTSANTAALPGGTVTVCIHAGDRPGYVSCT
ncbi:MAG: hypothetical protein V9F04_13670 [Dermatophilaceae bacterium]|jgi:hypothetical protein